MALTPQQHNALILIADNPGRYLAVVRGVAGYMAVNGNTENSLSERGLIRVVPGTDGPDTWEVTEAGLVALGRPVEVSMYVRTEDYDGGRRSSLVTKTAGIEEGRAAYRDAVGPREFTAHMGHAAKGSYQINYKNGSRVLLRPANAEELPEYEQPKKMAAPVVTAEDPNPFTESPEEMLAKVKAKLDKAAEIMNRDALEEIATEALRPPVSEHAVPALESPAAAEALVELLAPAGADIELTVELTVHGSHGDPFSEETGQVGRSVRETLRIAPGPGEGDREFTTRVRLA